MPGKKLIFMGAEIAQIREWDPDYRLDWAYLQEPMHKGIQNWVRDLNTLYRSEPALHELDFNPAGFSWVDYADEAQSIISFIRKGYNSDECILAVL